MAMFLELLPEALLFGVLLGLALDDLRIVFLLHGRAIEPISIVGA